MINFIISQYIHIDVATRCASIVCQRRCGLGMLASDSSCQLHVLGHNCDALCVDRTQVCVLKQTYKVGLRCFLESTDGLGLEAQISFKVLGNLSH